MFGGGQTPQLNISLCGGDAHGKLRITPSEGTQRRRGGNGNLPSSGTRRGIDVGVKLPDFPLLWDAE